jgi:DNA-binding LacI/PurR family transcriptional regulator
MSAPLTAVAQDWSAIGRCAVELLMRRLTNPSEPPRSRRIGTTLVTRRSCGCRGKTRRTAIPLPDDRSCGE